MKWIEEEIGNPTEDIAWLNKSRTSVRSWRGGLSGEYGKIYIYFEYKWRKEYAPEMWIEH